MLFKAVFINRDPVNYFFIRRGPGPKKIVELQTIFIMGHKQRYSLSRMLKDFDV
jgi:hypothetical protein